MWASVCLAPSQGERAEAIARLEVVDPEGGWFEAILAQESASGFDEANILALAKTHSLLNAQSVSSFLLRVCTESPFPDNRASAKDANDLLLPDDLERLFLALESTDGSLARQIVGSKRLPPDNALVLAKCDSFDPTRLLRCTLLLQADAPGVSADGPAVVDEMVRLRPELAVAAFEAAAAGGHEAVLGNFSGAALVRLLAFAGEGPAAVASGFHARVLRRATGAAGPGAKSAFAPVLRFLMRNHVPDVVAPALRAAADPSALRAALVPHLGKASFGDLQEFLGTYDHAILRPELSSLLRQLRPLNRRLKNTFATLVAPLLFRRKKAQICAAFDVVWLYTPLFLCTPKGGLARGSERVGVDRGEGQGGPAPRLGLAPGRAPDGEAS